MKKKMILVHTPLYTYAILLMFSKKNVFVSLSDIKHFITCSCHLFLLFFVCIKKAEIIKKMYENVYLFCFLHIYQKNVITVG